MKQLLLILIACNLFCAKLNAQNIFHPLPIHKRTSDLLRYDAAAYPLGFSKFMQNLNINGFDHWTSSSGILSINGIPYNTLPFNYTSPDFVPIELLQIESAEVEQQSSIKNWAALPSGGINFITKSISDSFKLTLRTFTGSETGDPLIYRFTRENIPIVNKNKIVPSFALSAEGGGKLKYRVTGGYFGYFAFNSSENILIMGGLGNSLTKRQNRQMLGSAELEYKLNNKRKISLFSSFINFYGWELPPFITSLIHLRTFNYANRLTFINLFDGIDAGIKADGNVSRIWELDLIPPAKIEMRDVALFARWKKWLTNKAEFHLYSDAGFYDAYDIEGILKSQLIFPRGTSTKYSYYSITPQLNYQLFEHFRIEFINRIEKNILRKNIYSGTLKLSYSHNSDYIFDLLFSTVNSNPSVFEKYAMYLTFRGIDDGVLQDFAITPNQKISNEQIKSVSASVKIKTYGFSVNINPFYRNVLNPIVLENINIVSTNIPGDIIRNAYFTNGDENDYLGLNNSIAYDPGSINLEVSHSGLYVNNTNPSNRFLALSEIEISRSGSFLVEYFYSSPKIFSDFKTNAASIFSPSIPEVSFFSISYTHRLYEFYSMRDIDASIRVENVFNKRMKFHPLGNTMDRTIEFYVSLKI